jgi:subtilisin family serine protease
VKRFLASLTIIGVSTTLAAAQPRFRRAAEAIDGQYIVVLNELPRDKVAAVAAELSLRHQGRVLAVLKHGIAGFGVELTEQQALQLANEPRVAFVEENGRAHISVDTQTFTNDDYWHLDRLDQRPAIGATKSYSYTRTGNNVNAYVIDTGVQARHVEFDNDGNPNTIGSKVALGVEFSPDAWPGNNPCGGYTNNYNGGHGTAAASVLGGYYSGVAKGVIIIPVKVGDCNANISTLGICYALDWIIGDMDLPENANRRGVISMSIFEPTPSAEMCDEPPQNCLTSMEHNINQAIGAGIPVVASANNQDIGTCAEPPPTAATSPARMGYGPVDPTIDPDGGSPYASTHHTITVGGTTLSDQRWVCDPPNCVADDLASNYGPCVSIYAPARNIRTAHIFGFYSYRGDPETFGPGTDYPFTAIGLRSGTSFAAPAVAGLAARVLQQFPTITPQQVWVFLWQQATRAGADIDPSPTFNNLIPYLSQND